MEWISGWVRNLAFYFIFLSILMNVIPQGEEKKYIRFFMGLLLVLLLVRPVLAAGRMDQLLEWETLTGQIQQEYNDFSMEKKYLELEGEQYVQDACRKEIQRQTANLLDQLSYETEEIKVTFFESEELELKEISCVIRRKDGRQPEDGEKERVKTKLAQVYNLPEGNINIKIQE